MLNECSVLTIGNGRLIWDQASLVSLVSVWARNWCYSCETVELVAECDSVELVNIHAGFMQVGENMLG